jgi:hypothetical protein
MEPFFPSAGYTADDSDEDPESDDDSDDSEYNDESADDPDSEGDHSDGDSGADHSINGPPPPHHHHHQNTHFDSDDDDGSSDNNEDTPPLIEDDDDDELDVNQNLPAAEPSTPTSAAEPVTPPPTVSPVNCRGATSSASSAAEHRGGRAPAGQSFESAEDSQRGQQSAQAPAAASTARPQRNIKPHSRWEDYGLFLSLSMAMKSNDTATIEAAKIELRNIIARDVLEFCRFHEVPREFWDKIITSSMLLKEKFFPNGDFDKLKARLVANGNQQKLTLYEREKSSSPTVSQDSLMLTLGISAFKRMKRCVIDFTSAYLNAHMKTIIQYMRLGKFVSQLLVEMIPELEKYMGNDGTIVVKLKKALYGLVEAARCWYDLLSSTLQDLGCRKSAADNCVFIKGNESDGELSIICDHVDDLFCTASSDELIDELIEGLSKRFAGLSYKRGNSLSYTGIEIEFNDKDGSVTLRQSGYIHEMLSSCKVTGFAATPATEKLFTPDPTSPPMDETEYRSRVMKIMYLAKRTRPDVLLPTAYLATFSAAPTEADNRKLDRVFMYINATRDQPLIIKPQSLDLFAYIDASHGTHADSKGHTGVVISLGQAGGTVFAQSVKQRIVTKSSTESELVGIDDGISQVLWSRTFMSEIGLLAAKPTIVFQDNQSTIKIAENGPGQKGRTRHLDRRYFYISEKIANKDIQLEYMPTADMLADLLTKPLTALYFVKLRRILMCEKEAPTHKTRPTEGSHSRRGVLAKHQSV